MSTVLGFTGTRFKPTDAQCTWLSKQFDDVSELHHGACVGADAVAHVFGLLYGLAIVVHPPDDLKLVDVKAIMPRSEGVAVLPQKPYLDRNRDIVDASDCLIALPNGPERAHSGTWYTVGYAVGYNQIHTANRRVIPVTICYPDGRLEQR